MTYLRVALIMLVLGASACLEKREDASTGASPEDPGISAGDSGEARTLAVATSDQVLSSMAALTGTNPSATTRAYFEVNRTSFALQGKITEITSGMWMAVTTLAGHVCDDLYNQERLVASASRIYYRDLNLGGSNTRVAIDVARNRLAIGIWGRAAYSDELGFFDSALSEAGLSASTLNGTQSRQALLILCAGTLGSLSAMSR